MALTSRRLRIAGAGLGALLVVGALIYLKREVPTPVAQQAAVAWPIAPEQLPPKPATQQPKPVQSAKEERQDYIVQAASVDLARQAVEKAGGVVTGDLSIIRAVGASLDAQELAKLNANPVDGLRVYEDAAVTASATALPETYYPQEVAATTLHKGGLTGRGVTVAVLDSGLWRQQGPLQKTSYGKDQRVLAQYDAIQGRTNPTNYDDGFGHGTHISSIIGNAAVASTGRFQGVAPGVNLVSVQALDSNGAGRYFDVIRGIQWIVSNKSRYDIRVLNMSLSAPVRSHYWDDPLNQAVMTAWASGIVVVVSAGNEGPSPMSIGVPGNNPYVITVGAVTDSYRPMEPDQYRLASFSSAGPTYEGFVKPEVVAMGGHVRAYAPYDGTLARNYPQWVDSRFNDFTMSGTSQAAAVTSGVVALMLDVNPNLTPDQVKCRLMDSARPAVKPDGTLAYSVFQQGAGLVNAQDAAYSTANGCANVGLNVLLDLSNIKHFGGRANQDADGNYYIMAVSSSSQTSLLGGLLSSLGGLVGGLGQTLKNVPL